MTLTEIYGAGAIVGFFLWLWLIGYTVADWIDADLRSTDESDRLRDLIGYVT